MAMSAGLTLLPQELLAVENGIQAVQQSNEVEGVVKDASGEPIIGATVRVVGTKIATVTDIDGNFKINAKSGQSLQITYVGCKPKTVKVGRGALAVTLEDDSQVLKDVQVVAYGVQKKVTVTGAISNINGSELTKVPTGSINNMLSGVVPGLSSVQYSGEPGADAATILVRGQATTNNSSPLIQVDGVERDFNDIDPSEIESITVLKDASATAVFGVRGANGVILVTTKRGKEGKAKISANTSMSVIVPTDPIKLANAYEYASYYNMQKLNDGAATAPFSDQILQKFKDHSDPLRFPDTDWIDYCFKDHAIQTQHNVNISGGTDRMRYFVSAGAFTQDGLFKQQSLPYDFNFKYQRFNYRANLDFDVTKTTTISVNLGGRVDTKNTPYSGEDNNQLFRKLYWATPFSSPGVINGKYLLSGTDYNDCDNMPFTGTTGLASYYGKGYMSKNTNTLNADVVLNQKLDVITKGLSFKLKGSYNSSYSVTKSRGASAAYYTPVMQPDGTVEYRKNGTDSQLGYGESFGKGRNWYFETSLNYNRGFGLHHVGGLVLYNQSKYYYPGTYSSIPRGYVGMVGRATYDWNNRYMAEFNVGYNGSENFAPGKRYGFFPAGSIGWVVSEEEFMKKASWIDFLKVRASYGLVGSDNVSSRFPYLAFYGGGSGYDFGNNFGTNVGGTSEGNLANANLTWEKARKLNVGIDFTTLNQRLALTIDAFYEYRFDIITDMNSDGIMGYPDIVGKDAALQNLGEVSNRGVDIELSWNDKIGKDFRYYIRPNLTFSRNRLEYKAEVARKNSWRKETGKRLYENFVYVFDHFVADQEEADRLNKIGYQPWGQLIPGDVVYKDLDRNGVIDDEDRTAMGNPRSPELMFGIPFGFQYKNFDFSVLLQGATKSSILLNGAAVFDFPQFEQDKIGRVKKMHLDRWTPETAATAKYPALHYGTHDNNKNGNSSLFLYDASYLRLKNVEIGYNVSPKLLRKFHVQQARIYVQGLNLLTFDKLGDVDIDPETKSGDGASWYPIQKVFNFGIDITF